MAKAFRADCSTATREPAASKLDHFNCFRQHRDGAAWSMQTILPVHVCM